MIWFYPQVMGLGVWAIKAAITGNLHLQHMPILLCIKMVATLVSLGMGFNGGVFAPMLFIGNNLFQPASALTRYLFFVGALLGSTCAQSAQLLQLPTAPDALFAFSGMGAMVASVFGAPVFAVIIVLEMTASFPATTYVLTSVTVAYLMSHELFATSLFQYQLDKKRKADELRGSDWQPIDMAGDVGMGEIPTEHALRSLSDQEKLDASSPSNGFEME